MHFQFYDKNIHRKCIRMFDTRTAIAGLYLWLLFGYLSSMVSCDIKRMMENNIIFRHFVGIVAFFLLFTVIDKDNEVDIMQVWMKTITTYFVFLLMTKSKWYFSIPTLVMIVLDQSIKFHIDFLKQQDKPIEDYEKARDTIYKITGGIICAGFIHYAIRQYTEFGKDFSVVKLLFHYECKN
jgi:hypothetical protein